MNYEINVSLNGTHFFATNERSIKSKDKLNLVLSSFKKKFPEQEGYKISIMKWEKMGIDITEELTNV